jgi:anion-transporting  ArsA/GET3 family ATPase
MTIHLVSGKGGVGKSLFSLALARFLQSQNQKVLLVELGDYSFYSDLLQEPSLGYKPQLLPLYQLHIACWNGRSALSEYVLHLLKIESLHRLFFENPITTSLVDAAPGLKELAILGKITSGSPRYVGPPLDYQCLVVDAFSSGHFLSLLKSPQAMAQTFKKGPMGEQSRSILSSIQSPEITSLHLVTLPEELPHEETQELLENLKTVTPLKPTLWMNKWMTYPKTLEPLEDPELASDFKDLEKIQEYYFHDLQKTLLPVKKIPFILDLDPLSLTDKMKNFISLEEEESKRSHL